MSRLSFFAWALALLALGVGAIGYAATGAGSESRNPATPALVSPKQPVIVDTTSASPHSTIVVPPEQGLAATLLGAGSAALDASVAEQAAGEALPVAGRLLRLWFGPALGNGARTLQRLEYRTVPGRKITLVRDGENFARQENNEAVDETPVRIRLVGPKLQSGLVESGLPGHLRDEIMRKLGTQSVTALDLIVAHEQVGLDGEYGTPLYLALEGEGGTVRRWLNVKGVLRPIGSGKIQAALVRPVSGPITSVPGMRLHPILRYLRWHRGTDFAAAAGTPVRAALAGRVVDTGWRGGYGRTVRIAHADGSRTLYAHLQNIGVHENDVVPQGAIVGTVGSSGLATGPHLHFEWSRGGASTQPIFTAGLSGQDAEPRHLPILQAVLSAPFRLPPRTPTSGT